MKGLDYFYDIIYMYDIKSYKMTSINLLWFYKERPVHACANTVICTKYSYTFIMLPILRKSFIFKISNYCKFIQQIRVYFHFWPPVRTPGGLSREYVLRIPSMS